ncbi:DUF4349 domain-containing protein [Paenibacillus sp. R14(2021)]|uniref:DUF4349 domain-containing protein n=1 Tax=Paenibacillus sp. R14(2021) TaxID=2859228 RepID=UPI001C615988|nr:DUF4349 domain-containing protein [Paenibacillus sp. R14(2021)]
MKMGSGWRSKTRFSDSMKSGLLVTSMLLMLAWMLAGCSASNSDSSNMKSANGDMIHTESSSAAEAPAAASMNDGAAADKAANNSTSDASAADAEAGNGAGTSGADSGISTGGETDIARKIIYKGNVVMEVEAYDKAQTSLRNLIHLSGGYLLNFADQKTDAERGGTFTIKVPAAGFDSFLSELGKIKHVSYESSANGTDVTEEYVDLAARLKARQVVEARLLAFMENATKTADLLQISKQLGDVQTEIEQIKGRMRYLDKNVAFSTIELRMYQTTDVSAMTKETKTGFGSRLLNAITGSSRVIYDGVQGLVIFLAGAIPVLAVLAVIGIPSYVIIRGFLRKREKTNPTVLQETPKGPDSLDG